MIGLLYVCVLNICVDSAVTLSHVFNNDFRLILCSFRQELTINHWKKTQKFSEDQNYRPRQPKKSDDDKKIIKKIILAGDKLYD
jgi:hypothetical protein